MWANPNSPNLPDFDLFIQNSMMIPAAVLPITISAPATPSLTASATGGSLATGMAYVKITYVSVAGETTPSAEASVSVTGPTGSVSVPSPVLVAGATGYNVYAASATGAEVLQNAEPVAIGTAYTITTYVTGTAVPPTANTAGSPWPAWALAQAMGLVITAGCGGGPDYTLTVYNGAGHILLAITPDQPGRTWFDEARQKFGLLLPTAGLIESASDQGTANTRGMPDALRQLTISDLYFMKTPWGRAYLAYQQDFGSVWGLT